MKHARKMVIIPADQYVNKSLENQFVQNNNDDRFLQSKLENEQSNELNSVQTKGDNLSRLDSEMYNILFSKKFNNEYEKSKNYLQVLQRYLHFKENERKELQYADISKYMEDINPNENLNNVTMEDINPDENLNNVTIQSEESFTNQASSENDFSIDSIIESVPRSYKKKAKILLESWKETRKVSWDENGVTSIDGNIINKTNIKDLLNHVTRKRINTLVPIGSKELVKFIVETDAPINLIGNNDVITQIKELSTPKKAKTKAKTNFEKGSNFMQNNNRLWITSKIIRLFY